MRSLFALLAFVALASAQPPLQTKLFAPRPATTVGLHRFAVVGDAGTGDETQARVIQRMLEAHDQKPFATALLLGDNVYKTGERSKFESALGKPFAPLLRRGVKLFGILGNHDVATERGEAQLRYLGLGKQHWYSTKVASGDVEIFAIDTTLIVRDDHYDTKDDAWRAQNAKAQQAWLEAALSKSTAKYKVVMGHHPLYSSGTRMDERRDLRAALDDVLVKGNVTAYLAGHQHIYERREPKQGVVHFVSGGGAREPHVARGRGRLPRAHAEKNHFMIFDVGERGLSFQAVDIDGNVFDEGIIAAR